MSEFRDETYDFGLAPGETFEPADDEDEEFDRSNPHIMTALGPIHPGALGFALHGEHLIRKPVEGRLLERDLLLDDVVNAASELEGYFATGGRAVVDLTTADAGRDVADVLWIAQRVPVHVILATGFTMRLNAGIPQGTSAETMVEELKVGIDGTTARAGIIAISSVDGETALRAVAEAHVTTGAPISLSARDDTQPLATLESLLANGVAPEQVIVRGFDAILDTELRARLLETGVHVSVDGWVNDLSFTPNERAALIAELVDAGHLDRILISGELGRRRSMLAYGGGPGFVYFIEQVPILLLEAGLSAPQVRAILIDNVERALTILPSPDRG